MVCLASKVLDGIQLQKNSIGDDGLVALSKALRGNYKLKLLNLDDNIDIGDVGAKAFSNMLKLNTALRHVDFGEHSKMDEK